MSAEITGDPWETLDELLGVDTTAQQPDEGLGAVAFYGRCSTEDNQDPETSHGWQRGNAAKFVEPLGGEMVAEFFDVGQSRSVPWERRPEAARLLDALADPNRGWDAVVVGEGTRCWFGNQFSLIAPRFAAQGVDLWVPELGGQFDQRNPSHKMLMSVLGGMSESERQHVQARVRAAMDAQVLNEGRHQGGRAPYGYVTVDGGPHVNPSKAAEGYRLRVLAIDEDAAEVVRRIFAEYLAGNGDRAIANALNQEGIPCPSANRPGQNRHRHGDGWQSSTVRAILENPRYTGYAVFGRWTRYETLLDPNDVAAGYVTRSRRADASSVVRSRKPAHPAIIDMETFTEVQLKRRQRGRGGLAKSRQLERGPKQSTKYPYLLRGLLRCGYCGRRMEGTPRAKRIYYRCAARTLVPGSPMLEQHPTNVYLREARILEPLNAWLDQWFGREQRQATVEAMLGVGMGNPDQARMKQTKAKLADAEKRLRRLQAAIESGAEPGALIEALNNAKADKDTAEAELRRIPSGRTVDRVQVEAALDYLEDVDRILEQAKPERLQELYKKLDLEIVYQPEQKTVTVKAQSLGRDSKCVGGGT